MVKNRQSGILASRKILLCIRAEVKLERFRKMRRARRRFPAFWAVRFVADGAVLLAGKQNEFSGA
jgi:hypothetical protein